MTENSHIKLILWGTGFATMEKCEKAADTLVEKGYCKQSEGEWILKSNGYLKFIHCSCCGKQEEWPSAYCPNCGAKMKGGVE